MATSFRYKHYKLKIKLGLVVQWKGNNIGDVIYDHDKVDKLSLIEADSIRWYVVQVHVFQFFVELLDGRDP